MMRRVRGMISVVTRRVGVRFPLFPEADDAMGDVPDDADWDDGDGAEDDCPFEAMNEDGEPEVMELLLEGRLVTAGERAELVWQESELTGMEGSTTKIGFAFDAPGLVSMLRSGSVNTALVFEAGRRHTCIYNTPFSAFEVCVQGLEVDNRLLADGTLVLDYLIEVRGNRTERCRMEITFRGESEAVSGGRDGRS